MKLEDCKINSQKIEQLDKRVSKLESQIDKDKEQIATLDKSLGIFITEMKNISGDLKTVVENFKESLNSTAASHDKAIKKLEDKLDKQEAKILELDNKIDQETVVKDAKKWRDITAYILTAVVGAIVTFILIKIGIK